MSRPDMPDAFPLTWPEGRSRTPQFRRQASKFDCTFTSTRDGLILELERLGASYAVLSSNVELRLDGLPYANRAAPSDPGVAVYFYYKKRRVCFACDRWTKVKDNIRAIQKTIEAMRGIERWGTGEMMDRAFSAFEALPAPAKAESWREILGLHGVVQRADIEKRWRELAIKHHPDKGGSHEQMARINRARDEALAEFK